MLDEIAVADAEFLAQETLDHVLGDALVAIVASRDSSPPRHHRAEHVTVGVEQVDRVLAELERLVDPLLRPSRPGGDAVHGAQLVAQAKDRLEPA